MFPVFETFYISRKTYCSLILCHYVSPNALIVVSQFYCICTVCTRLRLHDDDDDVRCTFSHKIFT